MKKLNLISFLALFFLSPLLSFGVDPGESLAPTCAAGGCGSRSCSFQGEISVMGSGVQVSNSVECDENYYSCCHLTAYCFSKSQCPIIIP
jgi:hypothetical protein